MKNSLWKLAVLAGVIGLGFLVVVQAQRGLSLPGVPQAGQTDAPAGSAQAALNAGQDAPTPQLGDSVSLDPFDPQASADPPAPADPLTAIPRRARTAPPAWPPAESGPPVLGNSEPTPTPAMPGGGIDFRDGPQPVAGAPTLTPVADNAPFDPSAPSEPPQPLSEPTPAASIAKAMPTLAIPADEPTAPPAAEPEQSLAELPPGRVRLAGFEDSAPEPFAADPVPTPAAEPPSPGPQLDAPTELDPAQASSAQLLASEPDPFRAGQPVAPSAAEPQPTSPPETVEVIIKARQADLPAAVEPPSALDPLPSFGQEPRQPAAPQSTPPPYGDPQSLPPLSAGPRETPAGPSPGTLPDSDPFGPFTVRPETPSPSVEEPQSAFPLTTEPETTAPVEPPQPETENPPRDSAALDLAPLDPQFAPERMDRPAPPDSRMPADSPEPFFGDEPEPAAPNDEPSTLPPATEPEPRAGEEEAPSSIRLYGREELPDLGAAPTDQPQDGPPQHRRTPDPLPPRAAPLTPTPEELKGDGIVSEDAPRGAQRPQLKIEKLAPPNAVLGQPLVYNIVVKNVGNSTAYEVTVEDRIPKGTRLDGTIPRAEMVGKKLVWKLGELEPDQESKIAVRVVPLAEGEVGSVATVNFVAEVAAETIITAPKIDFVLEGPPRGQVGTPVTYKFKVANTGTGDATNVWIRNVIPDALHHPDGNDLEYEVGVLPAGASREVALTVTPRQAGETANRAVLTADGGITVESESPIEIVGDKLSISRTGPKQQFLGRPAVFTNKVTNDADRPAAGVTVVENVPDGMDFVEASAGGQYDPARRTVTWRIDQLGPRESRDVQVTLLPRDAGTLQSRVTVTGANGGQAEITSETSVEGFAALGLEMASVESPIGAGEQVALRVAARNRGNVAATNVQVTITLPAEMELVSAQGPTKYSQDGDKLVFQPVPRVAGDGQAEFTLLLRALRDGNARVQVEIASDELQRPLTREEIVYILPANP